MPKANLKDKRANATPPPPATEPPEITEASDEALAEAATDLLETPDPEQTGEDRTPDVTLPRFLPDGFPNPKAMDVWQYMQLLTPEQWEVHIVYLYRKEPKPATEAPTGEPTYLEKLTQPFTIDYVKQKWGGKRFFFWLNRRRSDGQRGEQSLYRKFFRIDAAPIWGEKEAALNDVALAEKKTTLENTMLQQLVTDLIRQRDDANKQGKAFDLDHAFSKSVEILQKGSSAAIDMMVKNQSGGGGANDILKMLLEKLLDRMDKPTVQDPLQKQFMEAMMQRFMAPPVDPLAQLEQVLRIAEIVKGGGSKRSDGTGGWAEVISKALDRAPEILQQAAQVRGAQPPARAALPPGAPGGISGGVSVNPAAPAPSPESLHTSANLGGPPQVVIDHIKSTIVAMCLQGEHGGEAAQMADNAVPQYASELHAQLKTNPMALALDPILAQCQRSPHLAQFINDFVAYFEEGEEEETEQPAPAGPATVAAKPN